MQIIDFAKRHTVLIAILTGAFALVLTNSAFNTLLPSVTDTYGISAATGGWVIIMYMLAMTVTMPMTSLVVDRLGRKCTYLLGIGMYGVSSIIGGVLYQHIEVILLVRFLHGVAAGLMIPLSLVLLFDYYGTETRGRVVGVWGMLLTIAPAIGPTLGGFIMQFGELQQLFWLNLPFSLLSFVLCFTQIKSYKPAGRKSLRLQGIVLLMGSLVTLSLGIQFIAQAAVSAWVSYLFIAAGIMSLVYFVRQENKQEEPLIRYGLLRRNAVFQASLLISVVQDTVMFGVIFIMPLLFQEVLQLSPSVAGAMFIPTAVFTSLFVWIGGSWLDANKSLTFIVCGIVFVAISVLSFAWIHVSMSLIVIIVLMSLRGIGNGLSDMTMTAIGLQALPEEDLHEGSALSNTIQRLASSFGVMLLAVYYDMRWQSLVRSGELVEQAKRVALQEECVVLGILMLLTLPLVVFINKKRAGADARHAT